MSRNRGAEALFGYLAGEAIGRPVDMVIPGDLRETHWAGVLRAMRAPTVRDRAAGLPVLRADGQVQILAGRLLVFSDALGVALGVTAILTNDGTSGRRPVG